MHHFVAHPKTCPNFYFQEYIFVGRNHSTKNYVMKRPFIKRGHGHRYCPKVAAMIGAAIGFMGMSVCIVLLLLMSM